MYFIEWFADLVAKTHPIKLIEYGILKALTDSIGLETLGVGPCVVDNFHGRTQLPSFDPSFLAVTRKHRTG